jgi:hypothetical protein
MPPLSAADCISPAFSRTKLILFSPFMKGRTWKLSATAYLATAGNLFLPVPLVYLVFLHAAEQAGKPFVIGLIAGCTLFTALALFLFVLFSRLQFAYFEVVLNREQFIAPLWRKHRAVYAAWTWLKVVAGVAIVAAFALPIAAYSRRLVELVHSMSSLKPGEMPPAEFFMLFYGGFFGIYGIFILLYFVGSLGYDFLVPSLALESVPLAEAFRRFGRLVRAEPGQFTLYCVLKIVLGLVAHMALGIAFEIVILLIFAVVGVIALIFGVLLHLAGVSTAVLTALAVVIGLLLYLALFGYAMIIGFGAILTFLEAYSLYFLAGRYPLLGELLARSTPPPQAPPPAPPWNPAYYTPPPV